MGSSQTGPLLRNVRHRAMVTLVSPLPVLPTLGFSREFGLVCLWNCVFFKTWGLLVFGLILIEIHLFYGLVFRRFLFCGLLFFQVLWHFCCYNLLLKAYCACFYTNLLILSSFFRICLPAFYLIFLLFFRFVDFSCQRMSGLFFSEITDFWLVFQIYLLVFAT